MKDPVIRSATASDVPPVASLNAEVQALHFENRPDQFKPASLPDIERWIEQLLHNPAARVWVAESDSVLVGYVAVLVRDRPEGPFSRARVW